MGDFLSKPIVHSIKYVDFHQVILSDLVQWFSNSALGTLDIYRNALGVISARKGEIN